MREFKVSECVGCPDFHLCISDVLASTCSNTKINKAARAKRGYRIMCLSALSLCEKEKNK